MCRALIDLGHDLTLFISRSIEKESDFYDKFSSYYGYDIKQADVVSFFTIINKALISRIALMASGRYLSDLLANRLPDLVISRNLLASFIMGALFGQKLVYETHEPENGWRRILQRILMKKTRVTTVVISKSLLEILKEHHGFLPAKHMVLPDAAFAGNPPVSSGEKKSARKRLIKIDNIERYDLIAGYFGHLYPGRGIDVIKSLAAGHRNVAFFVFGGKDSDIESLRAGNTSDNLFVMGHIPPAAVAGYMSVMDVLLMPYQKNVSIGIKSAETSRWMSPMKMFEYMASGVPIISSKLPVLEEILKDGHNALLAEPDNIEDWSKCIFKIMNDRESARKMAQQAYNEFISEYNWKRRAEKMTGAGIR
jgi:glycosyltransferase involved in cell wall biosynthesis